MKEKKYEPVLDAIGSLMVPGLGSCMGGRWIDGMIFFVSSMFGYLFLYPLGLPFHVWSVLAALFPKKPKNGSDGGNFAPKTDS